MQTEDQQNDFINFGKLLPDLFAVFDLEELRLVYVNPAGLSRLNPSSKAGLEKQTLTDFIGVTVIDRF